VISRAHNRSSRTPSSEGFALIKKHVLFSGSHRAGTERASVYRVSRSRSGQWIPVRATWLTNWRDLRLMPDANELMRLPLGLPSTDPWLAFIRWHEPKR